MGPLLTFLSTTLLFHWGPNFKLHFHLFTVCLEVRMSLFLHLPSSSSMGDRTSGTDKLVDVQLLMMLWSDVYLASLEWFEQDLGWKASMWKMAYIVTVLGVLHCTSQTVIAVQLCRLQ